MGAPRTPRARKRMTPAPLPLMVSPYGREGPGEMRASKRWARAASSAVTRTMTSPWSPTVNGWTEWARRERRTHGMSSLSRRLFTPSASASSRQRRTSTRSAWGGSGGDFGKRMTLARLAMSIGYPVGGPLATPAALDWLRGGRDNASLPMAQATDSSYIGRPPKRGEGRRLGPGRGRYVDAFNPPGCPSAAFVRSPYAHARLTALRGEAGGGG